jgi:hypothetical protein
VRTGIQHDREVLASVHLNEVKKYMADDIGMSIIRDNSKLQYFSTPFIFHTIDRKSNTTHSRCQCTEFLMPITVNFLPNPVCFELCMPDLLSPMISGIHTLGVIEEHSFTDNPAECE